MSALSVPVQLTSRAPTREIRIYTNGTLANHLPRFESFVAAIGETPLSRHPAWLAILERGLKHTVYCLEVAEGQQTRGILPLAYVRSMLFGRFLVSLPYLDYGGPLAENEGAARALIDRAVDLADELDVRYLELRHEWPIEHSALGHRMNSKVHLRLSLPTTSEALWQQLSSKVRNQVRKALKGDGVVAWGGLELLPEFYAVFSRNMRDLGTPVFGRRLFRCVLEQFPDRAELCVVRTGALAVAAALVLHGWGICEVPSASSLRKYKQTNANMLLYWRILERAIERGQRVLDFGRSSRDSSTYNFKKQWGAVPHPAEWQYHLRRGLISDMRPNNPKYQRFIRIWQHLPVRLTRLIGPAIVRGIP
jgi:FemAB-related protein (PEP-CTERM system-associated)